MTTKAAARKSGSSHMTHINVFEQLAKRVYVTISTMCRDKRIFMDAFDRAHFVSPSWAIERQLFRALRET